ncbi:hypothetical protein [Streptomyces sp. NPDC006739]|uniref:hypothetical protein n=1 Tax=Streptomyces sp. NPDC006739 TaxID=3364763 RepID=UPI00368033CF
MEQRIGSSSQPLKGEPVTGAGFDPAFIPGLTSPASPEPADAKPDDVEPDDPRPEDAEGSADAAPAAGTAPREPAKEAAEAAVDAEEADADAGSDDADDAPQGPVFEAADRRARIVADRKGVRLSLDEEACEFGWDEIGAIETESPRFGKRFTITVHTPERRWYPIEIEATSRARFQEWEEQLDAVLDAYFEEDAG